jgi:hypothetical protein
MHGMAVLSKFEKKHAMAAVLQVRKEKRDYLGLFQSGANSLLAGPIVSLTFWGRG